MGKVASSVSIIGGADGPTSIFIAGKGGKVKLTTRIQNYFRKIKRNRIKKRITANPHTLEEVVEWLKREHGAVEVSRQSHNYLEQKQSLKASLIMRHRPDLLGGLMNLEPPAGEDVEALKAFMEQIQERCDRAAEIADDIFSIDFHIYEIIWPENGRMRIGVETVWQVLDGSFSGNKKTMKQLRKLYKKIFLYYGVTVEDIKNETERYKSLLGVLCS
ncbi:MAG: sodium ion-translocating decarboxylase subunit beta [Lachnospiraceae bacterium]|nr:sodium ion-translocating decarboxylase subunit beta [Lachnospiraceae bacterium]